MKQQTCPDIDHGKELGTVTDPEINEASGLVASQTYSGIFWTFNDSGGPNCLYALAGNNGSRVFKLCLEGMMFDFGCFALTHHNELKHGKKSIFAGQCTVCLEG